MGPAGTGAAPPALFANDGTRFGKAVSLGNPQGLTDPAGVSVWVVDDDGLLWQFDLGTGIAAVPRSTAFYFTSTDCTGTAKVSSTSPMAVFRAPASNTTSENVFATASAASSTTIRSSKGASGICTAMSFTLPMVDTRTVGSFPRQIGPLPLAIR